MQKKVLLCFHKNVFNTYYIVNRDKCRIIVEKLKAFLPFYGNNGNVNHHGLSIVYTHHGLSLVYTHIACLANNRRFTWIVAEILHFCIAIGISRFQISAGECRLLSALQVFLWLAKSFAFTYFPIHNSIPPNHSMLPNPCSWKSRSINPLNTKRRLLYLKTQFVPRCCAMY